MYPVDLPAVDDAALTSVSEHYLSSMESRPCDKEWFQVSQTSKVEITANNVRRLQLFDDDQPDCTLLALHPPDDPTQVVALYLHEKWWCVEDVLRTSDESRSGLILHKEHLEHLYEVEAPGGWTQRRNIWLSIQLGRYSLGINKERSPSSGETQRNEGDDSSQKNYNCRLDPTSSSTCNVNTPLAIDSSVQQIKCCDPSQGVSSPSSKFSGTGCCPAAHADDLDTGLPTRPPQSLSAKQALKSKPSLSADPQGEETGEAQRSAKRVRRT